MGHVKQLLGGGWTAMRRQLLCSQVNMNFVLHDQEMIFLLMQNSMVYLSYM